MLPQKISTLYRITLAGLVLTMGFTRAHAVQVQPTFFLDNTSIIAPLPPVVPPTQVYTLSPDTLVAGKTTTISLLGGGFNCNTTFSRETLTVTGKRIDLSFVAATLGGIQPILNTQAQSPNATPSSTDLTIACPMPYLIKSAAPTPGVALPPIIYNPSYNPQFTVPALAAGTYEVWATQMYECMYTTPYCKMAVQQKYAGTLLVKDSLRSGWFLKQKQAVPQKPFSLQLLNNKLGSCQTTFSHQSVKAQNGELWFSFLIETDPAKICIANFSPFGPTYDMTAMSPGAYPIRVSELLACQVNAPFCPIAMIIPPISDTLIVSATTGMKLVHNSSSSFSANFTAALSASSLGQGIDLVLPNETGAQSSLWQARLISASGQVLLEKSFTTAANLNASNRSIHLELNAPLNRGLYLLQVKATSGVTYTLPMLR